MKRKLTETEQLVADLEKRLRFWTKKSALAAASRARLPHGSSRARVTTAEANWGRAAEQRDKVSEALDAARAQLARERGEAP